MITVKSFVFALIAGILLAISYVFGDNAMLFGMGAVTAVRPLAKPGTLPVRGKSGRVGVLRGKAQGEQIKAVEQSYETLLANATSQLSEVYAAAQAAARDARQSVKLGNWFLTLKGNTKLNLEIAHAYVTRYKSSVNPDKLFANEKFITAWSRILWPMSQYPHMHDLKTAAKMPRGYQRISMWLSDARQTAAYEKMTPEKRKELEAKRKGQGPNAKRSTISIKAITTALTPEEGKAAIALEAESAAKQKFFRGLKDAKVRKAVEAAIEFTVAAFQSRLADWVKENSTAKKEKAEKANVA